MIDAYSIECAVPQPFENAGVNGVEDARTFDAHSDKTVHVEKATVAKFLVRGAPKCQSIVLQIQKRIKPVDILVQLFHCAGNSGGCVRLLSAEAHKQEIVKDRFVAVQRSQFFFIGRFRRG